jgi:8-oxo-dGTP diphosphatase
MKEEADLDIKNPEFFGLTNDIFESEGKHYITIIMKASYNEGDIIGNMEPEKSENWEWFHLSNLPDSLFIPLRNLVDGKVYGRNNIEEKV